MIAAVVPTRGRPEMVTALVERLLPDPAVSEVVVVTGAGDPALARLAAIGDPRVRTVALDPPPTAAEARLAGARAATAPLLLLLDDDVLPATDVASGHAEAHRDQAGLVVLGGMPVRVGPRRRPGEAAVRLYATEWVTTFGEAAHEPLGELWMGHLSVDREAYLALEQDAPAWGDAYYEDKDLGLRMIEAGLRGVQRPELRAEHLQRREVRDLVRDGERQGRGLRQLVVRHPERVPEPPYAVSPPLLVAVSRARRVPALRAVVDTGLLWLTLLAGRLHLWRLETTLARLLRRLAIMTAYAAGATP